MIRLLLYCDSFLKKSSVIFSEGEGDEFLSIEPSVKKSALRISNKVNLAKQVGKLHHVLLLHELWSRPLSSLSKLHLTSPYLPPTKISS